MKWNAKIKVNKIMKKKKRNQICANKLHMQFWLYIWWTLSDANLSEFTAKTFGKPVLRGRLNMRKPTVSSAKEEWRIVMDYYHVAWIWILNSECWMQIKTIENYMGKSNHRISYLRISHQPNITLGLNEDVLLFILQNKYAQCTSLESQNSRPFSLHTYIVHMHQLPGSIV